VRSTRGVLVAIVCLYFAAALQQTFAYRIAIFGAAPDFLLLCAIALGMLAGRTKAALAGFAAGLLHGALAGANIAAYTISRSFAAFVASWTKHIGYEVTLGAVAVITFLCTIIGEIAWMFMGVRSGIGAFLGATIGTALYNAVLVIPLYALLRRVVDPPRR
jgi:cell shape-determining protein MreD